MSVMLQTAIHYGGNQHKKGSTFLDSTCFEIFQTIINTKTAFHLTHTRTTNIKTPPSTLALGKTTPTTRNQPIKMSGKTCDKHGAYSGSSCTFCWNTEKPIKKSSSTERRRHDRGSDNSSTMSGEKMCEVHKVTYSGKVCTFCIDARNRLDDLSMLDPAEGLAHAEQMDECGGLHRPPMMN